jgi:hypothetical protein
VSEDLANFEGSISVARSPEELYDLVSDVTRMGAWSPICTACWWEDEGTGPRVGARFRGRNETAEHGVWETRSRVVAAERGREFAWEVGEAYVRWGYRFTPEAGGTRLTESWQLLPAGRAMFLDKYGPDGGPARIELRTRQAHEGIPQTLTAIKRSAEDSA